MRIFFWTIEYVKKLSAKKIEKWILYCFWLLCPYQIKPQIHLFFWYTTGLEYHNNGRNWVTFVLIFFSSIQNSIKSKCNLLIPFHLYLFCLLQIPIWVYNSLLIPPFIRISYITYMELGKISCDSVNRIEILSLLDRSIWFDEEWANNGIFFL